MELSYEEAVKNLQSGGMFRINPGLERITAILEKFGNPQDKLKCIHVAGTNGKGSVCAILNSILTHAGFKTGLYTSPHIFEYTERIKISGIEISQKDFACYFKRVNTVAEQYKINLTEFEMLTVMMFLYFYDNNVDIAVLETGLGGRFDATNVIKENLCAIITHIDLDHTDRLGSTKDKIAFEKAGIIKQNCPIITSMSYEAIYDKANAENSLLIFTSPAVNQIYTEALALKGLQQEENLALALTAIKYLFPQIPEPVILEGLKTVKNPFRFQYFEKQNLIVDASHNPNGIEALRKNLDFYFPNKKRRFVFGCLKTKDYEKMMQILFREEDEVYLYGFDYPGACTFEELKNKCPITAKPFNDKIELTDDKLNIICGSFYMIGKLTLLQSLL